MYLIHLKNLLFVCFPRWLGLKYRSHPFGWLYCVTYIYVGGTLSRSTGELGLNAEPYDTTICYCVTHAQIIWTKTQNDSSTLCRVTLNTCPHESASPVHCTRVCVCVCAGCLWMHEHVTTFVCVCVQSSVSSSVYLFIVPVTFSSPHQPDDVVFSLIPVSAEPVEAPPAGRAVRRHSGTVGWFKWSFEVRYESEAGRL